MDPNYSVHDEMYIQARNSGLDGWGGNERISRGNEFVNRFFQIKDIPLTGNLLELGCGEGHLCRRFARRGYRVTGVDISSTAISWAKEKAEASGIDGMFLTADLTDPGLGKL